MDCLVTSERKTKRDKEAIKGTAEKKILHIMKDKEGKRYVHVSIKM